MVMTEDENGDDDDTTNNMKNTNKNKRLSKLDNTAKTIAILSASEAT